MKYASHANFSGGMFQDIPRHLIPENGVYDASNVVITSVGSLAKRGPTVTAISAATNFVPVGIGAQRSAGVDARSRLYAVGISGSNLQFGSLPFSNTVHNLSTYTTSLKNAAIGQPAQLGDSIVFSSRSSDVFAWCGGVDFSDLPMTESTTTISCSTAANDPAIPVGATAAAKVVVGGYVHLSDGGTEEYTGRVVRVNPSSIECEPAPIRAGSFTQMDFWPVLRQVGTRNDGEYVSSAGCVGTFASGGDTRLLLGDVTITDSNGKTRSYPNRIVWSVSEASDATVSECDGLIQATQAGFPKLNYVDVQNVEQIIGLVPMGANSMLIVGTKECALLTGYLETQLAASGSTPGRGGVLTWSIRSFAQRVGCVNANSIQRTTAGVLFAADDGVYLTDGSAMVNLMENKISGIWEEGIVPNNVFTIGVSTFGNGVFGLLNGSISIYGSANINNTHYYISTSSGGFLCDLRSNFAWTRIPFNQVNIAGGAIDATQASDRVYAIKYGASASSSSTDRIIRLDTMTNPTITQTSQDADGAVVDALIETKAYSEGDPAQMKRFRHLFMTYEFFKGPGNGSFTVEEVAGLEGGTVAIASLPTTTNVALTTVVRYDMQVRSQAVTHVIRTTGQPNYFNLLQLTNSFNALRMGRVRAGV